jgi:hypothetical protein
MRIVARSGAQRPVSVSGDARRHPRFQTSILKSTLGDLVDLSGGGACIRCKGKPSVGPGQVMQLTINSAEQKLRVTARVVRVQRKGLWSHEVGLAFVDLKPGLSSVLEGFARFGFITAPEPDARAEAPTPQAQQPPKERQQVLKAILEMPDPYEQLHVPPTATDEEIKSAYRRIARECHPDVSKDAEAASRFIACTQAYELLADANARKTYDEHASRRVA